MLELTAADLRDDPDAIVAVKMPVPVPVRFALEAGSVQTLEGPVAHEAGAAICSGVLGESWPVQRQRFDRDYEPLPGTAAGADGLYLKKRVEILAKRIAAERFFVRVGPRHEPITGEAGDWLIQYSPEKRSIISDAVFRASYERVARGPDSPA
jgi:hypothetical protein